jgi:KUP system potassium uptake protein
MPSAAEPTAAFEASRPSDAATTRGAPVPLALGALGVVFGDLGTSPLYTLKECIGGRHGVAPTPGNVLGILSLVFWSLTVLVTIKYVIVLMRADNEGEGGILALLARGPRRAATARIGGLTLLGLAGAALLYGDGVITPAISVLSAVEGVTHFAPGLSPWIVPFTCALLLALFSVQHRGTASVGRIFGPVMAVWFLVMAALGAAQVVRHPAVLAALSPTHAVRFFVDNGTRGFVTLAGVVLAVTGGEALYADMGHFGRRPIRRAWLALVFPSLLLSYFGQGALLLTTNGRAPGGSSFFALVPQHPAIGLAVVALATAATIIASQALISGVFSLTTQAMQLGLFPRVLVRHTGETHGQVYLPAINWFLAIACLTLVVVFGSSERLAAAFGFAVSGTMTITSLLFFAVARRGLGWSRGRAVGATALFLTFELPFLAANTTKIHAGAYVPVVIGAFFFGVMALWTRGRRVLAQALAARVPRAPDAIEELAGALPRPAGTAVFMTSVGDDLPPVLVHFTRRVGALHERVFICTIQVQPVPVAPREARVEVEDWGHGFHRIVGRYGFKETPHIPQLVLEAARRQGLRVDPAAVSYFVGNETFLCAPGGRMGKAAERIFAFLSRNARTATSYFRVPPDQVVEIGLQIDL